MTTLVKPSFTIEERKQKGAKLIAIDEKLKEFVLANNLHRLASIDPDNAYNAFWWANRGDDFDDWIYAGYITRRQKASIKRMLNQSHQIIQELLRDSIPCYPLTKHQ